MGNIKTEVIRVRIDPKTRQALEAYAAKLGCKKSEVIRIALLKHLAPGQPVISPMGD